MLVRVGRPETRVVVGIRQEDHLGDHQTLAEGLRILGAGHPEAVLPVLLVHRSPEAEHLLEILLEGSRILREAAAHRPQLLGHPARWAVPDLPALRFLFRLAKWRELLRGQSDPGEQMDRTEAAPRRCN